MVALCPVVIKSRHGLAAPSTVQGLVNVPSKIASVEAVGNTPPIQLPVSLQLLFTAPDHVGMINYLKAHLTPRYPVSAVKA